MDQAVGLIEANIYMYEEPLELLKPHFFSPFAFRRFPIS
jgi:hypothetical protein